MRILFLTSRLPYPPNRGDRLRVFNFIKSLQRVHEVHLITFISRDEELQNLPALEKFCRNIKYVKKRPIESAISVAINLWRSQPLQSLYYRSAKMHEMVTQALKENRYDAIYIHLFRMAQFVSDQKGHYRILDLTDVISDEIRRSLPYRNRFWRMLYSIEYARIAKLEKQLAMQFEETWLISSKDRAMLASAAPQANILAITNGIDANVFYPIDVDSIPYRLIFTGHMGVPHNIDAARFFALEIFPNILERFPESSFIIAGAEPAGSVLDLASRPNVRVIGFVKDLNRELNQAQVFVAPLRFAAGIQNKALEAMAAGTPVVTTSIVNEGINAKKEQEILVADTADEYIMQLTRLFNDGPLRRRIGAAGLDFVRRNFSWDIVLQRMNQLETKLYQADTTKNTVLSKE